MFAECGARPNVVGNTLNGGAKCSNSPPSLPPLINAGKGLGMLWILEAAGLIGKNVFEDYDVSPIMIFSKVIAHI